MKTHLHRLTLLICLPAILLFTCAKPKDQGTGPIDKIYTSKIAGMVIDKQGKGISGVSVTSRPDGHTTTTFSDGSFELSKLTAGVSYTLFFSDFDYNDTVVSAPVLGLDDSVPLPAPVTLKLRYGTLSGMVYQDVSKTVPVYPPNLGVEVEKQNVSKLLVTPYFYLTKVESPADGTPVRLIAAKQDVGFGFLEVTLPPDTIISNLAIALDKIGGTVTGTVVETTPAAKSIAKRTAGTRPLPGVTVTAVGGALHDVTDSMGVYVMRNVPSVGSVVFYFTLNGKLIATINGVSAPEKGLISMPRVTIGTAFPPKYGFTLTASSITLALGGTVITPRVNVEPVNPSDTIRLARFYWNYDGLPGWDDSTKTSWIDIPTGAFNWQPGETSRPVYCKVRLRDGSVSDSVGTDVIRTIPVQDAPSMVSGVVVDKAGNPLSDVVVDLKGTMLTDITGTDGRFIFTTGALAGTADTLMFRKPGFVDVTALIASYDTVLTTITMDSILPPFIVANPVDASITDDSTATFVVTATGTGLVYQWQKNDTDITGATESLYTTPAMHTTDSGATYRCIVSNSKGSAASNRAVLQVSSGILLPVIVSNPWDTSIPDSSTATFSVTATGTGLVYQWQKNDTDIVGASASSYTTPVMRTADSGATYRCIVSNQKGSATSNRAVLQVSPVILPPAIVSNPKDLTVPDSSRAIFQIRATGTNLSYQWQMNDADIKGANGPSYATPFMLVADSGSTFRCIISNSKGSVASTRAILNVTTRPPLVVAEPKDAVVKERDSAQFSVSVSGTSPLSYQWCTTNGNLAVIPIPGAIYPTYCLMSAYSDSGRPYFCIITNSAGKDTSRTAILTVRRAPPLITLNPSDTTMYSREPVIFTVAAISSDLLFYQWQRTDTNGVTINILRATAAKYSITPTMIHNRMQFRCIVTNSAGSSTSLPARLSVIPAGIRQMKLIPSAKKTFTAGGLTKPGTMGPPIYDTLHQVTFTRDYFMDSTEVTQSDFLSVMGVNPSKNIKSTINPVEQVTWFDAVLYCNARSRRDGLDTVYRYSTVTGIPGQGVSALTKLQIDSTAGGYRLPAEAEFEYACHGGTTTKYWWGNDTVGAGARVWSWNNSAYLTRPVASKIANGYGLYDISGNVLEWCHDWYGMYKSAPLTDPTGPATGTNRVARGGSIAESVFDPNFRPQYRSSAEPGTMSSAVGFRCVLRR